MNRAAGSTETWPAPTLGMGAVGLLDTTDPNRLMRNIVGNHSHQPGWVEHCRLWEPTFSPDAAPAAAPVFPGGAAARLADLPCRQRPGGSHRGRSRREGQRLVAVGRDVDSDTSVAAYARLAAEVVGCLNSSASDPPATADPLAAPAQRLSRRARDPDAPPQLGQTGSRQPFLCARASTRVPTRCFSSWWTMRPDRAPMTPTTPRARGVIRRCCQSRTFPTPAYGSPRRHTCTRSITSTPKPPSTGYSTSPCQSRPRRALNARAAKNIKHQMRQRGRMIEEDDELDIKLANTREYNAQISQPQHERELDVATLIAVGAPTLEMCEDAVKQVRHELDQPEIAVSRWRGRAV